VLLILNNDNDVEYVDVRAAFVFELLSTSLSISRLGLLFGLKLMHACLRVYFGFRLGPVFSFINPIYSLSIIPSSRFHRSIKHHVYTSTMLFPVFPKAFELSAVCPFVDPFSMLFVFMIFALELSAVGPFAGAPSVHHILFPGAFIDSAVRPLVVASALYFIIEPISLVGTAVGPKVHTLAIFKSICKVTFKSRTVCPSFNSHSMLVVFFPLARVNRASFMIISSMSFSHILIPISFILVAITVHKYAKTLHFVFKPFSFVPTVIWPFHYPNSMFDPFLKRSRVDCA
jgi:hypothetical protein